LRIIVLFFFNKVNQIEKMGNTKLPLQDEDYDIIERFQIVSEQVQPIE
jgi:hypothetical protein